MITGSADLTNISVFLSLATSAKSSAQRLTSCTISKSTASRTATSASNRETSSKSSSNRSKRSSCATNNSLLRATVGSKLSFEAAMTSDAIRKVVRGVRNSCETSDTKRCCTRDKFSNLAICFSSDSAISLNAWPRVDISSCEYTFIRCLKSPEVNSVAIRAASRTGLTTCRTTTQVINVIKSSKIRPAISR